MARMAFKRQPEKQISSPEQMNEYIRVAKPGAWLTLIAVVLLLLGFGVWAFVGKLETRIPAAAAVEDGILTGYIADGRAGEVGIGETVRIGGKTFEITEVAPRPQKVDDAFPAELMYLGGFADGEWVRTVTAKPKDGTVADGVYEGEVIAESLSPVSFLWN